MSIKGLNATWGTRNDLICRDRTRMRLCKVCGKQAVKGQYCQSCADFLRKMQKRNQAEYF